jgi:hypothetical protein
MAGVSFSKGMHLGQLAREKIVLDTIGLNVYNLPHSIEACLKIQKLS